MELTGVDRIGQIFYRSGQNLSKGVCRIGQKSFTNGGDWLKFLQEWAELIINPSGIWRLGQNLVKLSKGFRAGLFSETFYSSGQGLSSNLVQISKAFWQKRSWKPPGMGMVDPNSFRSWQDWSNYLQEWAGLVIIPWACRIGQYSIRCG